MLKHQFVSHNVAGLVIGLQIGLILVLGFVFDLARRFILGVEFGLGLGEHVPQRTPRPSVR